MATIRSSFEGRRNRGGGAGLGAAVPTFGAGSSAPQEVCRCDRLTVMIIYRWKSLAFVFFLLCRKLTKRVDFYDVTGVVLVSLLLS